MTFQDSCYRYRRCSSEVWHSTVGKHPVKLHCFVLLGFSSPWLYFHYSWFLVLNLKICLQPVYIDVKILLLFFSGGENMIFFFLPHVINVEFVLKCTEVNKTQKMYRCRANYWIRCLCCLMKTCNCKLLYHVWNGEYTADFRNFQHLLWIASREYLANCYQHQNIRLWVFHGRVEGHLSADITLCVLIAPFVLWICAV